jgi:mannosyltransferase OCH1-like enzyme
MRIPQQLWQTSKSSSLSKRARKLQDSWRSLNPSLNITLMNDTEAAGFISSFYGQEIAALYAAYPLGVMRADFWRYAILYAYGGVYSDIDTECTQPLEQWFPPKLRAPGVKNAPPSVSENSSWTSAGDLQYDKLTWADCSMVVALENDVHMCQWTFAAVPGHPVLRSTLKLAVKSLDKGVQCGYDHMVHAHMGPGTWTDGLRDALGLPLGRLSAADIARAVWTDPAVHQRVRDMWLYVMAPELFGGLLFEGSSPNVRNHYSSQWQGFDAPNTPWVVEKAKLQKSLKSTAAANGTATD